jgi:ABC-type bacteriocin/lantibiotic exporter with double-glycine peptidase domain
MDIKKYDVKYLRSLISYAKQELVSFNKSIRDNYLSQLGNVDDMIWNSCDEVYVTEFISKLPGQ